MSKITAILTLTSTIILSTVQHGSTQINLDFYDWKKVALQTFRHRFPGPNSDTIVGLTNLLMLEDELENIDAGRLMWYYSQMPIKVKKKGPDIHLSCSRLRSLFNIHVFVH